MAGSESRTSVFKIVSEGLGLEQKSSGVRICLNADFVYIAWIIRHVGGWIHIYWNVSFDMHSL